MKADVEELFEEKSRDGDEDNECEEEFDVDGTVHSDTESEEDLRSRLAPNMARGALGGLGISSRFGL